MPRAPRYSLADQPHHVIQRGNNRTMMFKTEDDFRFYYESLRSATTRFDCQVHAYVFMTNHVHLLMTPVDAHGIGRAMRSLGQRYVGYFNRRHGRTGTLFEGRYRSTVIDSETYLFTCYRYIEENPVRAGLTIEPSIYRWSSNRANALGEEDSVLTPHEKFVALGTSAQERQSAYRALFRREIGQEALASIRFATSTGDGLGDSLLTARFQHYLHAAG